MLRQMMCCVRVTPLPMAARMNATCCRTQRRGRQWRRRTWSAKQVLFKRRCVCKPVATSTERCPSPTSSDDQDHVERQNLARKDPPFCVSRDCPRCKEVDAQGVVQVLRYCCIRKYGPRPISGDCQASAVIAVFTQPMTMRPDSRSERADGMATAMQGDANRFEMKKIRWS